MPEGNSEFELTLEAPFGAVQHYDSQWIAWAQTDPPNIHGVDPSRDPVFGDGEGETRYA